MTARRAVDRVHWKESRVVTAWFWSYTQYGKSWAIALKLMAHNRTPVIPPLSRGIKRCSRLWSRQYFPPPLKIYSEQFFFSESDWFSFLSENTFHLKDVTNINSGGFWILDDVIFASKYFNTSFHVTQQEYMLIVQQRQLRNHERSPYALQQEQKKLHPREKKRQSTFMNSIFFSYFTCYLERTNFDVMTTQINILAMEALLGIQCLLIKDSSKKNYLVFFKHRLIFPEAQ